MDFIQSLYSNALSGISNLVVYIAIVVLFVVGLIRCIAPVVRTRGTLRRAIRIIRSEGDKKYAWQEDAFLGKGALFGTLIGFLGCLSGMRTANTADGVGTAATSAVVGGMIAIAVADGLLAVVCYVWDV